MCLGPNACANCLYCTGRVGCVGVGVRCIQPTREVGGGDGGRCLAAACVDTMFFAVGTPVHGVQAWWREEAGAGPFLATVEKVHIFSQTYTIVWDDGGSEQRTRPASEVWRRDTVIDDDMTPGEEAMESSVRSVGSSDTEMTYFYPVSPHAPDSAPWQLQTAECKLQSENWSEQPRGKAQSVPGVDAGAGDGPGAEAEEPVPGSATVEPDTGGSSSPQPTTSEDEQGEHEEQVGEEDNDDDDDEWRAAMAKAKRASLVQNPGRICAEVDRTA